jgi:hypothetical protein
MEKGMTLTTKEFIRTLALELYLSEGELNRYMYVEGEALVQEFEEKRNALAAAIRINVSGSGHGRRDFCPVVLRHLHRPGETLCLAWGRLFKTCRGEFRTRSIAKAARGADYSIPTLRKMVPHEFADLVEETEKKAAELRHTNRILVQLRVAERMVRAAVEPGHFLRPPPPSPQGAENDS